MRARRASARAKEKARAKIRARKKARAEFARKEKGGSADPHANNIHSRRY